MLDIRAYDSIISDVYEAALVPAYWGDALNKLIAMCAPRDWEVAFLLWERHDPPVGRFLGTAGVNEVAQTVYQNVFAGRNEWSQASRRLRVGMASHSDDLISRRRFKQTSIYRDFLKHWGYGVAIIGMLDRHGPDQLGLVLPGPLARDPGELLEAIQLLLPHFQRAARISRRIQEADLRAATAHVMLDQSPYSVFALGPDMALQLANSRAQLMLGSGGLFSEEGGRLIVKDTAVQEELVAMTLNLGKSRAYSFSLYDEANRQHLFTALAVSDRIAGQFDNDAGGASLMLVGGQRVGISGELVEQIEQTFGLTAAESRLAGHIVQGSGLEGYARDRTVSLHAARYLLKNIYAKTGVTSQSELTALLNEAPLGWTPVLPA